MENFFWNNLEFITRTTFFEKVGTIIVCTKLVASFFLQIFRLVCEIFALYFLIFRVDWLFKGCFYLIIKFESIDPV